MSRSIHVLFVCLGNICRSPTAEGFFRALVDQRGLSSRFHIDSAGTSQYHVGEPPDQRAVFHAGQHGVDLSGLRARQFVSRDYDKFDYILAMDHANLEDMQLIKPQNSRNNPKLFLSFDDNYKEVEVPDPYYGGADGFEHVITLIKSASLGLLQQIENDYLGLYLARL